MRVAVIGSRNLKINNFDKYLPANVTELVSGGAVGIDSCIKEYALSKNIKLCEFLPEYNKFGKVAPLKRNLQIIAYSDLIIAFWDGKSRGTKFVIEQCKKQNKNIRVYIM